MNLDALTPTQSEQLSNYLAGLLPDQPPLVCQVLTVCWPDQARSYLFSDAFAEGAYQPIKERAELGLIEARLRLPGSAKPFFRIFVTADINDNTLNVEWNEGPQFDTCVRKLFAQHGENIRGEVFLYFPAIDLLCSEFVGHFRLPDKGNQFYTPATLVSGFKSKQLQLPDFRLGWNGCQWVFGGQIHDAAVLARNGCRYNRHRWGTLGTLDPTTNAPRTFCKRDNRQTCDEVMGTSPEDKKKHFGGSDKVFDQSYLGQRGHGKTVTNTYNLESRAKNPLGILFGYRKKFPLQLVQVARQDPLSPTGTLLTRWLISHGPIKSASNFKLRGKTPQGSEVRLGTYLQAPLTNFYDNTGTDAGNYSLIAHCSLNENPVKSAEITFDQVQAEAEGEGFTEVRHYNADGSFTDQYSQSPTWIIRTLLEHPRFGLRIHPQFFVNSDWVASAEKDTANGIEFNHYLQGGPADKVIEQICDSMGKSLPFWHGGKLRFLHLGEETITDNLPTFYAQGEQVNILAFDGSNLSGMPGEFKGIAAIRPLQKSANEIPRRVLLTFDDDLNEVYDRVVTAEAAKLIEQDFRGSNMSWPPPEKEAAGIGITNEGHAKQQAVSLLEVGSFQQGGTRNNCGFELVAKGIDPMVLNLHPWALTRVLADAYDYLREPGPNYDGTGPRFEHFRVVSKERDENLQTKLTVWAYPRGLYEEA